MVGAIIQARMNSSRLPGKILKQVCGKPLLELLVERLKACHCIDKIIVATTINQKDDAVEDIAKKLSIDFFRGSEDDVLDRYYQAAEKFKIEHIIRITADCPILDPVIVDTIVKFYLESIRKDDSYDYVSNTLKPTFPDGLDVEIFGFEFLKKLHKVSTKGYQREHVCTYMLEHPEEFRMKNMSHVTDLSDYRWTVDSPEDFELIKSIYEGLYPEKRIFLMDDILFFLDENPELKELNKHLVRNEGFISGLEKENLNTEGKEEIISKVLKKSHLNEI